MIISESKIKKIICEEVSLHDKISKIGDISTKIFQDIVYSHSENPTIKSEKLFLDLIAASEDSVQKNSSDINGMINSLWEASRFYTLNYQNLSNAAQNLALKLQNDLDEATTSEIDMINNEFPESAIDLDTLEFPESAIDLDTLEFPESSAY